MLRYFQTPTLLFAAILLLLLSGCAKTGIHLKKNENDQAVRFASNRLDGKRQKTKHVKALETAFAQANEKDLLEVDRLRSVGTPAAWEKIHALNLRMQKRQARVEPLMPLVSDDGYRPDIRLLPVREMVEESRQEVVDRYFAQINENMELARMGKRLPAREAFDRIGYLQRKYDWNDPAAKPLAEEARSLGKVYVLLEIRDWSGYPGTYAAQQLNFWGIQGNNGWQVVHQSPVPGTHYDFLAQTTLHSSWVSPDNISRICRDVNEEVQVGSEAVTDTNGVVTYKPIYKTVSATICDITATKTANMSALFEVFDYATGQHLRSEPIFVMSNFNESFSSFTGDARVKATAGLRCSDSVSFPSDWQMIDNCIDDLRHQLNWLLPEVDVEE